MKTTTKITGGPRLQREPPILSVFRFLLHDRIHQSFFLLAGVTLVHEPAQEAGLAIFRVTAMLLHAARIALPHPVAGAG